MVKGIIVKILSVIITLLLVISFLALLDILAAVAIENAIDGNPDAWQAFFAINLFQSLINIFTQTLKMVVSIPFYVAGLVSIGEHLAVLGQSLLGLLLSFLFFCLNLIFGLGGFFFSILKLLLGLLPFTNIPSDATVITLGMMLGWELTAQPDWLWWLPYTTFEYFYNLPLITHNLLAGLGSKIAETLTVEVPLASHIFWLDIVELGFVPSWTNFLIETVTLIPQPQHAYTRIDYFSSIVEFDPLNCQFMVDISIER